MERNYKMKSSLFILVLILSVPVLSQWVQTQSTPAGGGITDMVVTDAGALIVTTSSFNWPNGQYGGIRRSTDGGEYWEEIINGYTARTLAISRGGYIFASSWPYPNPEALYRSTDNGSTFFMHYPIGAGNNIFSIIAPALDNNTIYLGTRNGVLKSTNGGTIFNPVNNGIPANSWVWDLAVDSNSIFAAATSNGLFISTNSGDSWQQTTGVPAGDTIKRLCFFRIQTDNNGNTDKLYAGTNHGSILETDAIIGGPYLSIGAIRQVAKVSDENEGIIFFEDEQGDKEFFAGFHSGANGGGVYRQRYNGLFEQMNDGFPQNPKVSSIVGIPGQSSKELISGFFNNTINGAAVYKRDVPIGIQQISNQVTSHFSLSQNYPNPFNPATNIEFSVSKSSFVKLVVYDLLGRVLESLVNRQMGQGVYQVDWNASKYPSGVYFYRITAGNFTDTKKMILIK